MLKHIYSQFLIHYSYLEKDIDSFEEVNNYQMLLHMNNGSRMIYDGLEDRCRKLPSDSHSMSEKECTAEFAARLRNIMRFKGCSQKELSERTGISQPSISNYAMGKTSPNFYNLDRIAKALDCSVDELRYL